MSIFKTLKIGPDCARSYLRSNLSGMSIGQNRETFSPATCRLLLPMVNVVEMYWHLKMPAYPARLVMAPLKVVLFFRSRAEPARISRGVVVWTVTLPEHGLTNVLYVSRSLLKIYYILIRIRARGWPYEIEAWQKGEWWRREYCEFCILDSDPL